MNRKRHLPQTAVVLKGLRGREGLTQVQLAKKIDLSKSTISNIETGKRNITEDEAKKFARALKTKPKMFED